MSDLNILKISKSRPDHKIIDQAARILSKGGIIVAPTETKYGLLGRIDDAKVMGRIYDLKGRKPKQPCAVFVRSHDEIFEFGCESKLSALLAQQFLPGPLTLVLKDKSGYPEPIVVGGKIGIRFSSSPIIAKLLNKIDFNVTATSANISGAGDPETIEEIAAIFRGKVDMYLDGGNLNALPSTVVDCSCDTYKILRSGAFTREEIKKKIVRL